MRPRAPRWMTRVAAEECGSIWPAAPAGVTRSARRRPVEAIGRCRRGSRGWPRVRRRVAQVALDVLAIVRGQVVPDTLIATAAGAPDRMWEPVGDRASDLGVRPASCEEPTVSVIYLQRRRAGGTSSRCAHGLRVLVVLGPPCAPRDQATPDLPTGPHAGDAPDSASDARRRVQESVMLPSLNSEGTRSRRSRQQPRRRGDRPSDQAFHRSAQPSDPCRRPSGGGPASRPSRARCPSARAASSRGRASR
jgi:hypothetical protein